jgi:hypothetical protein
LGHVKSKAWWPKEGEEEGSPAWWSIEGEGEGSPAWWSMEGKGEGSPTWWPMEGSKLGGQWGGERKKSFSLLLTFPPTNFI